MENDNNDSRKRDVDDVDEASGNDNNTQGGRKEGKPTPSSQINEQNGFSAGEDEGDVKEDALEDLDGVDNTVSVPQKDDSEGAKSKKQDIRDERRMELNRQRAKDIRKRKKKRLEDMQKQIIFLTLENNKLRTQAQMQQTEIEILRRQARSEMFGNVQQQVSG